MSSPVQNKHWFQRCCACCFKTEVELMPKVFVTKQEFHVAIGNTHKHVASTDFLSDRKFIKWIIDDEAFQKK